MSVNLTIVPDSMLMDDWADEPEPVTTDESAEFPLVRPNNSLSDAVDWFIDEGDEDDDLPRLQVATTDEEGPPSVSLEDAQPPAMVDEAPTRSLAMRGAVAAFALGAAGAALIVIMGITAMSAGAATVWFAS